MTLSMCCELAVEIKFMLTSNSVRTAKKTHRFFISKTSCLMVFMEILTAIFYFISRSFPLTVHCRLHEESITISFNFSKEPHVI
jgi:hypothetical protein